MIQQSLPMRVLRQREKNHRQDLQELTNDFYTAALAQVGIRFAGLQEGLPTLKIEPRVLFFDNRKNLLAISVSEFTVFSAVLKVAESEPLVRKKGEENDCRRADRSSEEYASR